MKSVDYLRSLGFKRISLKTGSWGMEEPAMAMKFATDAELDLPTMDGSGGGTGMLPGFQGSNIKGVLRPGNREKANGNRQ